MSGAFDPPISLRFIEATRCQRMAVKLFERVAMRNIHRARIAIQHVSHWLERIEYGEEELTPLRLAEIQQEIADAAREIAELQLAILITSELSH